MAKVIKHEEKTYIVEDGRGTIMNEMKAYNNAGVDVLIPYQAGTRLFRVNNSNQIVLEDLMGRIIPMGTEEEYIKKKESHTMRILSVLAV